MFSSEGIYPGEKPCILRTLYVREEDKGGTVASTVVGRVPWVSVIPAFRLTLNARRICVSTLTSMCTHGKLKRSIEGLLAKKKS